VELRVGDDVPQLSQDTFPYFETSTNQRCRRDTQNNVSERWHNRFAVVVGKHHPDFYTALREFQKEQADTKSMVAKLSIGRKVRAAPKQKWVTMQKRIQSVVANYSDYKDDIYIYLPLNYVV